jgi:antitoxin MazE
MKTKIQRWGNSLAVRIPRSLAEETRLTQDSTVELSLDSGRLVLTPVRQGEPTLNELLAGVTEENIHEEWDTGPAVGAEVW